MHHDMQRVTAQQAHARPHLDFVLPGLLAGSVGMIVGQGAIGKSYLAMQIGLAVATGQSVAGGLWSPGAAGPVTVICGEDDTRILQERLYWLRQDAGIDDDAAAAIDEKLDIRSGYGHDLRILVSTREGLVDGPFRASLTEMARGQRLIIIDPLAWLSDAAENDNPAMTRLMQTLHAIARDTGCTIIVLHHVGKGGEGDREEWTAARGASAITTAVRWQVNMRPPRDAEIANLAVDETERPKWVRAAIVKSNYGETPPAGWLQRGRGGVLRFARFEAPTATKAAARKYATAKGVREVCDDDF